VASAQDKLSIQSGIEIPVKIWNINSGFAGVVQPLDIKDHSRFEISNAKIVDALIEDECQILVESEFHNNISRHLSKSTKLSCKSGDITDFHGFIVDSDNKNGIRILEVGKTVKVFVRSGFEQDFSKSTGVGNG